MFTNRYRYLYILLLSIYSFLNILVINEDRLYIFELNPLLHFLNILLLVALLWEGNGLIARWLVPKLQLNQTYSFIAQFATSILLCLLLGAVSVYLMFHYLERPLASGFFSNFKLTIGFTFRVNLFLNIVNIVVFYAIKYREKEREADQLKIETVEAQYMALRNQVNPHFLFNSLNVLANLVYKDAETAEDFLHKLADVYRYILQNEENSVVPLSAEMEFLDAYFYLLKIRFRNNIALEQQIPGPLLNRYLPPSTLQILVENAIKHNTISSDSPLRISIFPEGEFLIVENSLQQSQNNDTSNGVGLSNIVKRYALLSDRQVAVNRSEKVFRVKIPLLNITEHETINR